MKTNYSLEIVNAIKKFFESNGWKHSFNEEKGTFKFTVSIKSTIRQINCLIQVRKNDYIVYALSPIGVEEDDYETLLKLAVFICLVNYGHSRANFELDVRDGEIRCKTYVDCAGEIIPNNEIIRHSVSAPALMFERYSDRIAEIICGSTGLNEAVEVSEKNAPSLKRIEFLQSGKGKRDRVVKKGEIL